MTTKNKINKAFSILKRKGFFALTRDVFMLFLKKTFFSNKDENIFQRYDESKIFYHLQQDGLDVSPSAFANKKIYVLSDINISNKILKYLGKLIHNLDNFSNEDIKSSAFYICFKFDEDALPLIKKIKDNNGIFIPHLSTEKTPYRFTNKLAYNALVKSWKKKERVSHLRLDIHENICEALDMTKNVEGDYLEIGVYLGGSALTALNYLDELKSKNHNLIKKEAFLFDTFDGFNYERAHKSSDAIWKNTHKLFGVEKTKNFISETFNNVATKYNLIENNIVKDDIPTCVKKISVANIDVDLYEPTIDSLSKVAPLISKGGGIIIVEDALSTPKLYGAYLAMNEFLETEMGKNFVPIHKVGQYFLIKKH